MKDNPADKARARMVVTSRCERCGAGLVILCKQKLQKERSYTFACPGCQEQLERRLACEFLEVRRTGAS